MERIVYRITLDSHKTGIQRTLQGFETADNMARTIAVNITASGDTYEIPLDNVVAMMYVTTPGASEPSVNECRIEDNTIIYDVLPIVEEGITEMQLKLIETSVDGAKKVLIAPRFAVEVTESGTEDDGAEQTTTFTALEAAIAKAQGVYDARLLRIDIGEDCVFRAIYADGTVYENHYFHEALYNGNALLSESWAKGGTGIREGEETNNSKYFSDVSRSSSIEASASADEVRNLVDFAKLHSTYTSFDTNFETGELEYISASHTFDIDETTGELSVEGDLFDPSEVLESVADDYMDEKTQEIAQLKSDFTELEDAFMELAWLDNVDVFSVLGTDATTTKFYKIGVASANAPIGFTYFSLLKTGNTAFAFGASNQGSKIAISRLSTGGGWSEWISSVSMDLLWQNASPTSAFDEQTIVLNLENYRFVLIITDDWIGGYQYISNLISVGTKGVIHIATTESGRVSNKTRNTTVRTSNIYFEKCRKIFADKDSQMVTDNLIPYQIYGIK